MEGWALWLPAGGLNLVRGGYYAVGTFFALSGFVLARSYGPASWNRSRLMRYGVGRFARIYPVYLLSLLIVAPIMFSDVFLRHGGRAAGNVMLLANYGLVLQGWSLTLPVNWNTPAWSLSCEFFFYLCFPLAVVLVKKISWPRIWSIAGAALLLPALFYFIGIPPAWRPIIHLSDFLLGIAAAGIFEALLRCQHFLVGRGYWLYVPAALIGAAVIAYPNILGNASAAGSVVRPMNGLLILGLALGGGMTARALSASIVVFLGQASYSLYILHIPLLWWYKPWWFRLVGSRPSNLAGLVFLPHRHPRLGR